MWINNKYTFDPLATHFKSKNSLFQLKNNLNKNAFFDSIRSYYN